MPPSKPSAFRKGPGAYRPLSRPPKPTNCATQPDGPRTDRRGAYSMRAVTAVSYTHLTLPTICSV
eukprot:5458903-Alexandrium_andersonii.AAC.1